MKITPVLHKQNVFSARMPEKNNKITGFKSNKDEFISFKGKTYPSGWYSDQEIGYAKKYLGVEGWEEKYFWERFYQIHPRTSLIEDDKLEIFINIQFLMVSALIEAAVNAKWEANVRKITNPEIARIKGLMTDLNNEKIQRNKEQSERLNAEINKLEAINNQRIKKEELSYKIKETLNNEFLTPLKNGLDETPTVVMLETPDIEIRKDIWQWLKDTADARVVEFKLQVDKDDPLYRLRTELVYAQEKYRTTGKRTVLFVDKFTRVLNSDKTSGEIIGHMKAFLTFLSKNKEPLTIVFNTNDRKSIDPAFLSNRQRIQLRVNFDKLMLGQRKTWKAHLDEHIKSMSQNELEIHKCWLTQMAENALKEENYADIIKYKETNALICEMQEKERDAYLLRCDIENYLKKV